MNSLKDAGCKWTFKPADNPMSWTQSATRFTPPKPCDIITCDHKGLILIECKQMKKFGAFGIDKMQPSQIKNLSEAEQMGQRAFVFLNVRIAHPRTNICFAFDWLWLTEYWRQNGSIKKPILEGFARASFTKGVTVIEGHKERFDLKSLLNIY